MFSKACEHAIRATLLVATYSLAGGRVSIKDIAEKTASPVAFTAKIMQQLSRGGILCSVQGKQGGFEMTMEQIQLTPISQIVALIDGDKVFTGCGLGLPECNSKNPCPLHERFSKVRGELKAMLDNTTVLDLAQGLNEGLTYLRV